MATTEVDGAAGLWAILKPKQWVQRNLGMMTETHIQDGR
jgi:hypothetical protein